MRRRRISRQARASSRSPADVTITGAGANRSASMPGDGADAAMYHRAPGTPGTARTATRRPWASYNPSPPKAGRAVPGPASATVTVPSLTRATLVPGSRSPARTRTRAAVSSWTSTYARVRPSTATGDVAATTSAPATDAKGPDNDASPTRPCAPAANEGHDLTAPSVDLARGHPRTIRAFSRPEMSTYPASTIRSG